MNILKRNEEEPKEVVAAFANQIQEMNENSQNVKMRSDTLESKLKTSIAENQRLENEITLLREKMKNAIEEKE